MSEQVLPTIVNVIVIALLAGVASVVLFRVFVTGQKSAVESAGELERLRDEALSIVDRLSQLSAFEKEDLKEDIDIFSAPVGGMPDVLRAMIRCLPSHYGHDVAGAALVLHIGREHGMDLALTADGVTGAHVELFTLLEQKRERDHADPENLKTSKGSLDKVWVQAQKDICFAMDHLDEYPMLLPIIRDRGITDVREALEAAKVMAASDAKSLSSGML